MLVAFVNILNQAFFDYIYCSIKKALFSTPHQHLNYCLEIIVTVKYFSIAQ